MPSLDNLLNVSSEFGRAVLEQSHWNNALQGMADAFGGTFATYEVISKVTGRHLQHYDSSAIEIQEEYLGYYMPLNPRIAFGNRPGAPRILHDNLFISEQKMDRHEFYSDFLSLYDLRYFLSFKAYETNEEIGVFTIQKSARDGSASDEDLKALQLLAPTLSNVGNLQAQQLDLLNKLSEFEQYSDASHRGMVVLEEPGLVRKENQAAAEIFRKNDGLTVNRGKLVCGDPNLDDFIKTALFSRDFTSNVHGVQHQFLVPRPSGLAPYQVTVLLLEKHKINNHRDRCALLIIDDPLKITGVGLTTISQFYGFTPAEAVVATSIAQGKTASEIAAESNVTVATIRTQIQRIMQKMSVNRQSEIVRILTSYS